MSWILSIAAVVAAVDQATKLLIVRLLADTEARVIVPGYFNLVNWRNTGAAWGMFRDNNLILTVVSLVTLGALYLFRHSLMLSHKAGRVALGLIGGGIVGNLADRVRVGSVIDFLDFYYGAHHWPAFNVADSAICVGVGLYIFVSWRHDRKSVAEA